MLFATGWQLDMLGNLDPLYFPVIYSALMVGMWNLAVRYGYDAYMSLSENYGPFMAGPMILLLNHVVVYHLYAGIQEYFDRHPKGPWAKYKMHRRDEKLGNFYGKIYPNVLRNQLVVFPITLWFFYIAFGGRGFHGEYLKQVPTWSDILIQGLTEFAVYETIFYVGHRALHHRSMYNRFHSFHHSTKASTGISGLYMHWVEFFLTQALPIVLGPVILDSNPILPFVGTTIGSLHSVHSHGAYEFPFIPKPGFHEAHHARLKVCFATGPLDWLCGTGMDADEQDALTSSRRAKMAHQKKKEGGNVDGMKKKKKKRFPAAVVG